MLVLLPTTSSVISIVWVDVPVVRVYVSPFTISGVLTKTVEYDLVGVKVRIVFPLLSVIVTSPVSLLVFAKKAPCVDVVLNTLDIIVLDVAMKVPPVMMLSPLTSSPESAPFVGPSTKTVPPVISKVPFESSESPIELILIVPPLI